MLAFSRNILCKFHEQFRSLLKLPFFSWHPNSMKRFMKSLLKSIFAHPTQVEEICNHSTRAWMYVMERDWQVYVNKNQNDPFFLSFHTTFLCALHRLLGGMVCENTFLIMNKSLYYNVTWRFPGNFNISMSICKDKAVNP